MKYVPPASSDWQVQFSQYCPVLALLANPNQLAACDVEGSRLDSLKTRSDAFLFFTMVCIVPYVRYRYVPVRYYDVDRPRRNSVVHITLVPRRYVKIPPLLEKIKQ